MKTLCFTGRRPKDMGFKETTVSKYGREYLKNTQNKSSYADFVLALANIIEKFYEKWV